MSAILPTSSPGCNLLKWVFIVVLGLLLDVNALVPSIMLAALAVGP